MFRKGWKPSTIRTRISGIKFEAAAQGILYTPDKFIVNKLIDGVSKLSPPSKEMQPITKSFMHKILKMIRFHTTNEYLATMLKALILITYHGCFRAGEVVVSSHGNHTLRWNNLQLRNVSGGIQLHIKLKSYKHHRPGGIDKVIIKRQQMPLYCPVNAMVKYVNICRDREENKIFQYANGTPVNRKQFESHLKSLIALAGSNPQEYNTHSLRIGKITDMARAGFSITQMKQTGRWKSSAYQKYIRSRSVYMQ